MPRSTKPLAGGSGKSNNGTKEALRDEVREALRSVLHDATASAAAKASAGRTLLEYFGGDDAPGARTGAAELTVEELDAEIARLTPGRL